MRHLTPHEGEVLNNPRGFSPDSTSLYITTDDGSEFAYLAEIDLESGEREVLFQPDWDVWFTYFSQGGHYMIVGVNEDARTRIHMYEMPGMHELELPAMEGLDITSVSISDDETTMAFYAGSSRSPSNLFLYELGGAQPRQLTDSLTPAIQTRHLVDAEVVRFTSDEGVEIPGLLYKPHEGGPGQQGSGSRVGARRARRPVPHRIQGFYPVPRQPRVRGVRNQQPRQLRLWEDIL